MTFSKRSSEPARPASIESEASAAADRRDFETLFQQYWERVCGAVYRLVGDWAEAEDLALETFLRLYQTPPASQHNLGGWLYRVATNLGYNALRARKRRQQHEEEASSLPDPNDPAWNPAEVFERAQERQRVRETLARMKPRSAQILILRSSGLSYNELAGALDVAPASVGTLLARAEEEFEREYQKMEELWRI